MGTESRNITGYCGTQVLLTMGVCVDCGVLFSTLLTGRILHCGECDKRGVKSPASSGTCKCNCANVIGMLKTMESSISELRASDKLRIDKMEKDIAAMKTAHDSDKKEMEQKVTGAQEQVKTLEKKLDDLYTSLGVTEPEPEPKIPKPSKTKIPVGNPKIM